MTPAQIKDIEHLEGTLRGAQAEVQTLCKYRKLDPEFNATLQAIDKGLHILHGMKVWG